MNLVTLAGATALVAVSHVSANAETTIRSGSGRSYWSYGRGYSAGSYSYSSTTYVMRGFYTRPMKEPPPPVASRCAVPAFEVVNPDRGESLCAARR